MLAFRLNSIYYTATALRVLLLVYGKWQDENMEVKFTDVDYHVFDEAARFAYNNESPYLRGTYRYTPLLALILQPNVICKIFGKCMFIAADILTAMTIKQILSLRKVDEKKILFALLLWLFNPITCAISCRGNAESVMALLVNLLLLTLMAKKTTAAGLLFGLAVHFKIYPITFSLAIFLFLGSGYDEQKGSMSFRTICFEIIGLKIKKLLKRVITLKRVKFFVTAAMFLFFINLTMYKFYGDDFLEHTYLYHVKRRDIRHNFSVFFYMLYLSSAWWQNLVCFVVQVWLILIISFKFSDDLPFCFFLLTFTFVTFNKVVTSQYFIWYIALLPILIDGFSKANVKMILGTVLLWLVGQAVWLNEAYKLEFLSENNFLRLWVSGLVHFLVNVLVVVWCIKNYAYQKNFDQKGRLSVSFSSHCNKVK